MASSYSTRFRLNFQAPGDNLNVWGTTLNTAVFQLLEDAMAKRVAFALSGAKTLTSLNGATDEARCAFLDVTSGTGGTITAPPVEKLYLVRNGASGDATVTTGAGLTATFKPGEMGWTVSDGTNFRKELITDFGGAQLTSVADPVNPQDVATRAFVLAQAFAALAGNLPGQAGSAGKFLSTNGSVAGWAFPGIAAVNALVTTSTTVVGSNLYVPVAMAALGQSVTLPDATTLSVGGPQYIVDNSKGTYPAGIRDSAGTLLMAVAPGGVAFVGLKDKSTAAGAWSITGTLLEPGLVTIDNTFSTTYSANSYTTYVALDNNTSIHFLTLSSGFAAFILDGLGRVVGTPVTVDAATSMGPKAAFKISATSAIVFYSDGGSNSKAVVLTVSGASPSLALAVGTPAALAAAALASTNPNNGVINVAQLSATLYACAYSTAGALTAVAVSVAGAVITVGAVTATILTTAANAATPVLLYPLTATTCLCISKTGAAAPYTVQAFVISVAGTTATAGGIVSTGLTSAIQVSPSAVLLSPTLAIVADDANTTSITAAAFSIAGNVITAGAPVTVETISATLQGYYFASFATPVNPHLWSVSATAAGLWYLDSTSISRALVLSVAGVTITPGAISYRSISNGAANAAGNGFIMPQTATEFCSAQASAANTAGFGISLVPCKISGSSITQGAARPVRDAIPTAPSNYIAGRLPGGDYALFTTQANNAVMPVFRSNGDVISPRGEISIPFVSGTTFPVPVVGNRVVLLGSNQQAPTAGLSTYQMRLVNVEIAA